MMPKSSYLTPHSPIVTTSERNTASILEQLAESNLETLRKIKERMGTEVHELLLSMDPKPKILLKNVVAVGSDADGIASNDGSSKYLMGGLISYSGAVSDALPLPKYSLDPKQHASFGSNNFNFYRERAGANDYSLIAGAHGNVSGDRAEEITLYAGDQKTTISENLVLKVGENSGTPEHRQALQELSTIAIYDKLLTVLNAEVTRDKVFSALESSQHNKDPLIQQAKEIFSYNQDIWSKLLPLLQDFLKGKRISIGESFTSGILARIITSNEGASGILDYSLNWYDPRLKQMVGVPPRNTQEDLIAEPETIALATLGLLQKSPESTQMTLGTTGWANYWIQGEPDYFSVGVAEKTSEGPKVSTAYVKMTSSKDAPRNKGRRQLTRHLGGTVGIYMLVHAFSANYPSTPILESIKSSLMGMIQKYATIQVQENCY